jgi:DNA polymerase
MVFNTVRGSLSAKNKMKTYALDFESYYDKRCSITTLGPRGYFSHPDFDAYMMSIVGDDGTEFCGAPADFDWSLLNGNRILSHNASFDQHLYNFGVERNWWPSADFAEWHCTADMVACLGLPRSLKNASAVVLGVEVDKSTRDNMSGKKWSSMTEDFKKEVIEYAIEDSRLCLRLWQELSPKWPERERRISLVNRTAVFRGIPIDQELLSNSIAGINRTLFETEESIPWVGDKPILSRIAFNDECRKNGLEPPASLALDSDEANEFLDTNSEKYPWVNAVRNYRRINSLKRKLESFDKATMDDGRFYGGLMYFGAHTGRFSGSGGNLNLQNLPRGEMFGVDLRSLIAPAAGNRLLAVDLSQIEVRTLCWLAKDKDTMAEIAASDDIYEAFAVRFGLWDKSKGSMRENDPKTRHTVKSIVLGCGYGCGPEKFSLISKMELDEAEGAVSLYREKMRKVVTLWRTYNENLGLARDHDDEFSIELPSGRSLNYGKLQAVSQKGRTQFIAMMTKHAKKVPVKLYGGLLAENASQALARDIFCDMLCRIHDAGLKIIFHVHDEVVLEVPEESANVDLQRVIEIMSTPPDWIPDIPLAAEGSILTKYTK